MDAEKEFDKIQQLFILNKNVQQAKNKTPLRCNISTDVLKLMSYLSLKYQMLFPKRSGTT